MSRNRISMEPMRQLNKHPRGSVHIYFLKWSILSMCSIFWNALLCPSGWFVFREATKSWWGWFLVIPGGYLSHEKQMEGGLWIVCILMWVNSVMMMMMKMMMDWLLSSLESCICSHNAWICLSVCARKDKVPHLTVNSDMVHLSLKKEKQLWMHWSMLLRMVLSKKSAFSKNEPKTFSFMLEMVCPPPPHPWLWKQNFKKKLLKIYSW
jgi:hypothetical protein